MKETKIMTLSTKDLKPETMALLRSHPDFVPLAFFEKKYPENAGFAVAFPNANMFGWFVKVPEDDFDEWDALPPDLRKVVAVAVDDGYGWIMIDPDDPNRLDDYENEERTPAKRFVVASKHYETGNTNAKILANRSDAMDMVLGEIFLIALDFGIEKEFDERPVKKPDATTSIAFAYGSVEIRVNENEAVVFEDGTPYAEWWIKETFDV